MGLHLVFFATSLMSIETFFYFVPVGKTICKTISLNNIVFVLWSIALAKGTIVVERLQLVM